MLLILVGEITRAEAARQEVSKRRIGAWKRLDAGQEGRVLNADPSFAVVAGAAMAAGFPVRTNALRLGEGSASVLDLTNGYRLDRACHVVRATRFGSPSHSRDLLEPFPQVRRVQVVQDQLHIVPPICETAGRGQFFGQDG